jgi:hypothetical protein
MEESMVQELETALGALAAQGADPSQTEGIREEIELALIKRERTIVDELNTSNIRPSSFLALKLLATVGEALIHLGDEGPMKVWRMDQYVVNRDFAGNLLEIIIHERINMTTLPEETRQKVEAALSDDNSKEKSSGLNMYTRVWRNKEGMFQVAQEVEGVRIDSGDEDARWTEETMPYFVPRWTSINGEDYGRGHVEEYIGDLRSLEVLTKAIVTGSAAAAKVVFLLDPMSGIDPKRISNTRSGGFAVGSPEGVRALQLDKFADFRVAAGTIDKIEGRLSHAFLLNTAIQRQAERVTAEEIRFMAQELEDALGGVFSSLSQEFQLPLLKRIMRRLEKAGKLEKLPEETVRPTIITGIEALGRGHDLNKLRAFVSDVAALPQTLPFLNIDEFLGRLSNGHGIDPTGLIKSAQQVNQELQQQQQAQVIADSVPGVSTEAARGVNQATQEAIRQEGEA